MRDALPQEAIIPPDWQAQAVAAYGAAALVAFRQVENALANERLLARRLPYEQSALANSTDAVRIATIQYRTGRRDLLWVANLQTNQLALEALVIRVRSLQRANRIRLHLALGGSFEPAPATVPSAAQPTHLEATWSPAH